MTLAAFGAIVFFLTVQALLSSGPDVKKEILPYNNRTIRELNYFLKKDGVSLDRSCLLYTSPSPRDG